MTSEEIFRTAISQRNKNLYLELLHAHRNIVMSVARRFGISDVDDFAQEVIVSLIQKKKLPPANRYRVWVAWLRKVAEHAAIDRKRKRGPEITSFLAEDEDGESHSESVNAENEPLHESIHDRTRLLSDFVSSPRDRAVIRLSYGFDPKPEEWNALSAHTGIPVSILKHKTGILLDEHGFRMTQRHEALIKSYTSMIQRYKEWSYSLDRLNQVTLPYDGMDQESIRHLVMHVRERRIRFNKAYRRYRAAQEYKIIKINAIALSKAIGVSADAINQILTRARRSIRAGKKSLP